MRDSPKFTIGILKSSHAVEAPLSLEWYAFGADFPALFLKFPGDVLSFGSGALEFSGVFLAHLPGVLYRCARGAGRF